jgi:UDP-3-O-[3-hydroxymyristoyl] N-acetylglucosamine deacetylase
MTQTIQAAVFKGRGITSRRDITVRVSQSAPGSGLRFVVTDGEKKAEIPAIASSVVNTLRNVTLGGGGVRLCIVEHILCALAVWGVDDAVIEVDGPELPLGDGGAKFWNEAFAAAGWEARPVAATRELPEPVIVKKGDRVLMAIPDNDVSFTYLMDWNHPAIGRVWATWAPSSGLPHTEISDARTFGSMAEHQLLGIADEVVSLTPEGFSHPLRWPDEPVRHKILDVIGDLVLAGVNPLSWKARFISIKGGHELDVELAKRLSEFVKTVK